MKRKRELIERLSLIIRILLIISKVLPKSFYRWLLKLLRNHDNYLAMFLRYVCLKNCTKSCGNNVAIFSNVYLFHLDKLVLGDNVSIHPMCYIDAAGGIEIGNDVSIAHNTSILSEEHIYIDLSKNIKDQGCESRKTVIMDNVWIGAGSRILGGVTINSGSIVAAGAVVKGVVQSNSIVGGIPARIIKERE